MSRLFASPSAPGLPWVAAAPRVGPVRKVISSRMAVLLMIGVALMLAVTLALQLKWMHMADAGGEAGGGATVEFTSYSFQQQAGTQTNAIIDVAPVAVVPEAPLAGTPTDAVVPTPSPTASTRSASSLRVLTYATHPGYKFCLLLSSCQAQHLPLITLGWRTEHKGLGYKLLITLAYLDTLDPSELVLFVDAFDVVMSRPSDEIVATFHRAFPPGTNLVFSAEKGCWPYVGQKNGQGLCNWYYPDSPTMYKFVNTGSWIGRAGAAATLLRAIASAHENEDTGNLNDQELVTDFFVCDALQELYARGGAQAVLDRVGRVFGDTDAFAAARRIPGCTLTGKVQYHITLDYHCHLFQSVHNSEVDQRIHAPQDMGVHLAWDQGEGRWRNHVTGTYPAVFHFNGGGKRHIEPIWARLPHRKPGDDRRSLRSFDVQTKEYSEMKYEEICDERDNPRKE